MYTYTFAGSQSASNWVRDEFMHEHVCVLHLPNFSFLRTKSNFLISKFNVTNDNDDIVKIDSTCVQPAKANGDKTE